MEMDSYIASFGKRMLEVGRKVAVRTIDGASRFSSLTLSSGGTYLGKVRVIATDTISVALESLGSLRRK
jgi:hypothetical protein